MKWFEYICLATTVYILVYKVTAFFPVFVLSSAGVFFVRSG